MAKVSPDVQPLLADVREVAAALHISPTYTRQLIASGDLPHLKIGRRVLVRWSDVHAYVDNHGERAA